MKYILFLFIIITLSLPAIAQESTNIEIIENNGQIFSYNKKTQEKIKLVNGHKPLVSHDRTKFAYIVDGIKIVGAPFDYLNDLYLYDIQTKNSKLIFHGKNEHPETQQYWFGQWSPDDKYITIDQYNEVPVYETSIINVKTGETILKFDTGGYRWLNTQEIINSDLEDDVEPPRPTDVGTPHGIAIINIFTGKQKIIKHATPTEDYHFSIDNNNQIIVEKYVYTLEKTHKIYISGIDHVTTYIMDRNTFELKEIKTEK